MTIIIRTDASLQIGSGHVMRCITLADELRKRGADVFFICRNHHGNLIGLLEAKGYAVTRLPGAEKEYTKQDGDVAHASWLDVSWQQDAAETIAALGETQSDWLIIDHYAIDLRWEEKLRHHVSRIMVIDDLADRPHDCDLLLDQNLYHAMETRYNGLVPAKCNKLLGPNYALLRPEFAVARKNLRQRDGQVKRLLVFFGGVDPTNETEKALQALAEISSRQFEVDVVVGAGNPHKEKIQELCTACVGFQYHCQVDNMAELMAKADLAIGAGGTTTWERCAVGLPALVITVAENQEGIARSADDYGVLKCIGESTDVSVEDISCQFCKFCSSKQSLLHMSEMACELVDTIGTLRVTYGMEQL